MLLLTDFVRWTVTANISPHEVSFIQDQVSRVSLNGVWLTNFMWAPKSEETDLIRPNHNEFSIRSEGWC